MLWMVALVTLLPLVLFLADSDWIIDSTPDDTDWEYTAPDLLAQVMEAGDQAEVVWGAWVRVSNFDPATDMLMIDAPEGQEITVTRSASAEGDTYLMLSDGTRIVLERVADLPCPPEDLVFVVHA